MESKNMKRQCLDGMVRASNTKNILKNVDYLMTVIRSGAVMGDPEIANVEALVPCRQIITSLFPGESSMIWRAHFTFPCMLPVTSVADGWLLV
jgi:hypothetical protein